MTDALREKLQKLPDKPGCYLFRDGRGKIIYVGKAASLRHRVQSYFRGHTLRHAPPKLRSLIHSVADLDILVLRNEDEALLTESRLIKDFKPRYNILMRDDKRYLAIRADPREPVPRFTTARIVRDDGAKYFGPFTSGAIVHAAIDFVERRFGIRKCKPVVPDALTYEHCINDIVRFCSAPCVGRISAQEYLARFEEACAFLRGERVAMLAELEEQMQAAAKRRDFETAARLRDTLFALRALVRNRAHAVTPPTLQADLARRGLADLQKLLGLAAPPHIIEAFDISNIFGAHAVASMVCAVDGVPDRRRYRSFRIQTVEGADDPAMIAEVVGRQYLRLAQENLPMPDLVLVDGGVTQLRAARGALQSLGLGHVPSAGLAKEREEIVRDDGKPPVILPRDSAALQVLQRLRDEAHRFAIGHHRRIRNRLIRESALDEIPGIGPQRKMILLKTFGSIYRLARADVEAIAAVSGIGPTLAATIKRAVGGDVDETN
jgi:excinuclease ABC subunit C